MQTFLFYDIETTGLNYAFDQVLQFAAVRTDPDFHELQREEIMVKLRPDVIPSPGAMIAHGISIPDSMSGLCEFEATLRMHQLLNTPNTISLGYNTLGFDDEFLRFAFYRNLLPPYTHQYANNCGRMDLLPMVTMYWLYKNDVLNWPELEDNACPEQSRRVSLKLEHLSEANRLTDGTAHQAIYDVEACVELARVLRQEQEMWNYLAYYFHKETDISRKAKLPRLSKALPDSYRFGLLIDTDYGSKRNYQAPVLFIGDSIPYRNQSIWLRLDLPTLLETTPDSIPESTWVIRKKYGQLGLILPPRERFLTKIDEERWQVVEENKAWLQANPELLEKISQYYRQFAYPDLPDADPDALLYQIGFPSFRDEECGRRFHSTELSDKPNVLRQFESPVLKELATRVLFRNYAEQFPGFFVGEYTSYMSRVHPSAPEDALFDYRGEKRLTPAAAQIEIDRLRKEVKLTKSQKAVLKELEAYLKRQFGESPQLGLF